MHEQEHRPSGHRGHRLHHQTVDMGIRQEEIISPWMALKPGSI